MPVISFDVEELAFNAGPFDVEEPAFNPVRSTWKSAALQHGPFDVEEPPQAVPLEVEEPDFNTVRFKVEEPDFNTVRSTWKSRPSGRRLRAEVRRASAPVVEQVNLRRDTPSPTVVFENEGDRGAIINFGIFPLTNL